MQRPVLIGVAGGTGSGKTTVATIIKSRFEGESVRIMHHDSYYQDRSELPMEEREKINYDHPSAFENVLLAEHLRELMDRRAVEMPVYDYSSHTRLAKTVNVQPVEIILLEGILVLADELLRSLMSIKIYIQADSDERFIRRLLRDMKERGRDADSVIEQYVDTVRPMHLQFVEPTKRYADIIIPEGGHNAVAMDLLITKIRDILRNSGNG
ncbi:MAG: uridine kinase [Candidatus Eisenbacteria bacterium]